jgi:hypothetical protein
MAPNHDGLDRSQRPMVVPPVQVSKKQIRPPPPPYCTDTEWGPFRQSRSTSSSLPSAPQDRNLPRPPPVSQIAPSQSQSQPPRPTFLQPTSSRPTSSLSGSRPVPSIIPSSTTAHVQQSSNAPGHPPDSLVSALVSSTSTSQNTHQCLNTCPTTKDESPRLRAMQIEITSLKSLLHEYGHRIAHLESMVASIRGPGGTAIAHQSQSVVMVEPTASSASLSQDVRSQPHSSPLALIIAITPYPVLPIT